MATFASNMNADLGMIAESVLGTTPVSPSLVQQPFESFTLTPTTSELVDGRKTGSRELAAVISGNTTYSGTLGGPLSFSNYDGLFESAMFGAWTADVLKVGSTRKSFTTEVNQKDVNKFVQYRGVLANGFTLDSPAGSAFTTVQFDLVALGMTASDSTIDAGGGYTPTTMFDGFKSCGGIAEEGGVAIGNVQTINLTYTNNLNPLEVWGECEPSDFSEGQIDITGTLTIFYSDHAIVNKFIAGSYSSLEFTLEDAAGNSMTFFLPKIKYTGADMPVESGSGERLISLPFRAVKDAVEGTGLVITRTPA